MRHVIPLLGRLSPDPSAYRYLSESIFEFGSGPEFEAELAAAGFEVLGRRSFLLGATRLWAARRAGGVGQKPTAPAGTVQPARRPPGEFAHAGDRGEGGLGTPVAWLATQVVVSALLAAALAWALVQWAKLNAGLPLTPAQRSFGWVLIVTGVVAFGARTAWLGLRLLAGARGR